ncbi:MAG: ABC-F family ATP-binding cassette domain-containing protein [Spirochaetaceae bacterium]|jgi:ATP-binding cassette subfamily F protein uup|nr:ABC-F family ATP-binding cassette domain-containing protein [Spirochaetaceae bacterium]
MNLLSLENVNKTLNSEALFQEVTLGIDQGDKIGFIGPNGSGKSTFLRLLAGQLEPDGGNISRNRDLKISFLEQQPRIDPELDITSQLYLSRDPRIELLRSYHRAAEEAELGQGSMNELEDLTHKMDEEQAWNLEKEYLSYLTELGITDLNKRGKELSGGMTRKVGLARMLASGANLIFLDEPTNHLDVDTIEWLENWLYKTNVSFVMVTHDRYFLDRVCNVIMELDRRGIFKYPGNYADSLKRKQERLEQERRAEEKRQTILRRELEWLAQGPKARATRDKKRLGKVLDLMDQETGDLQRMSEFTAGNRRLGKKVLELFRVEKSFGKHRVVAPFSYSFKRGERIGIIGPNGSGKTTFLDLLTGRLDTDGGRIDLGINTHFGYFDQMGRPMDPKTTVLDFIKEKAEKVSLPGGGQMGAAAYLEQFLFPSETHRLAIERLSGGERRRLYLLRILMENPNFLILDEPTNDLDLETLSLLENYVEDYQGCLIIVSHDRAFLDRSTDYLFIFDNQGNIRGFSGNYSDYRETLKEEHRQRELKLKEQKKKIGQKVVNRSKKGLSYKEQIEIEELMERIILAEEEKEVLEGQFSRSDLSPMELQKKNESYKHLLSEIETKTYRWEELAAQEP